MTDHVGGVPVRGTWLEVPIETIGLTIAPSEIPAALDGSKKNK